MPRLGEGLRGKSFARMALGRGVVDGARLLSGLTRRRRAARAVSNKGDKRPYIVPNSFR